MGSSSIGMGIFAVEPTLYLKICTRLVCYKELTCLYLGRKRLAGRTRLGGYREEEGQSLWSCQPDVKEAGCVANEANNP